MKRQNKCTTERHEQQATLFDLVESHADYIMTYKHGIGGASAWFQSFISSDEWHRLSTEAKKQSFEAFQAMEFIANHIVELNLTPR